MSEYTAKDVILSTKDKLEEISRKLKRLEDLTCIDRDKRIHYVDYDILSYSNKKPEIRCTVIEKNIGLKGMVKNSRFYQNLRIHGLESGIILRNNNGNSYILNDKYKHFIPERAQEEFGHIVDEIINDELTLHLSDIESISYPTENNGVQDILIDPKKIMISKSGYIFSYYPKDNTANFETFNGLTPRSLMIEELLNRPIDETYIPEYAKKMMDSSPERKKDIIVPQFDADRYDIDFNVEEDAKKLTLVKTDERRLY